MNISFLKSNLFNLVPFVNSEKLRIDWAKSELKKIPDGQRIIDVGAGEELFRKYSEHLKYTSQDLGGYTGKGDKRGMQTGNWNASGVDIISDITDIPVKNSSYENALCTAVLEHIPYPDLAIKEISRILKRNGKLFLDAPFCSQTHFSPYFYATGLSDNWYRLVLPKYGFKISKILPYGNYFDYLALEFLRFPLVASEYSYLKIFAVVLYLFTIPMFFLTLLLSAVSKGSERQLCFGYHVIAIKK